MVKHLGHLVVCGLAGYGLVRLAQDDRVKDKARALYEQAKSAYSDAFLSAGNMRTSSEENTATQK